MLNLLKQKQKKKKKKKKRNCPSDDKSMQNK